MCKGRDGEETDSLELECRYKIILYNTRTCAGYTSHKYIYIYISMRIQKGSKDMQWVAPRRVGGL